MGSAYRDSKAIKNGQVCELATLSWSVTDIGTTQGVMLVERLRTVGGAIVNIERHRERLFKSAELIGLNDPEAIDKAFEWCEEVYRLNRQSEEIDEDFGIVVLLSPGDPGIDRTDALTPTVIVHIAPLPFKQLKKWYQEGASLRLAGNANVPWQAWSPKIKSRSRLQYYLADHAVSPTHLPPSISGQNTSSNPNKPDPHAIAILPTIDGALTESSVANFLLVRRDGRICSPCNSDILQGVSLSVIDDLLNEMGRTIEYGSVFPADMAEAEEILLTGTNGLLWAGVRWEEATIGNGLPGKLCIELQTRLKKRLGFDFCEQAIRIGSELS
jgi:branched-chain amino acid aminotransferase